jgi:DHA1 family multidrug resistance protein-like MFS transporter
VTPAIDWRRNLAALWFAEFMAIFGFSFCFPFLPLFLAHELGIRGEHQLAFWTGVSAGASGITLAIGGPFWGILADRYGRIPMLLRSMIGGGLTVALMGLARNPIDLTLLRFVQGVTSGTVAAATALVASETPRAEVGRALGVLTSAIALGSAVGPMVGGLLAPALGFRTVFFLGGGLLIAALVPVLVMVRETPLVERRAAQIRARALPTGLTRGRGEDNRALATIMIGQALLTVAYTAAQQLVVLRLLALLGGGASTATGIAFGAAGIASTISAVSYSWVAGRTGYLRLAIVLSLVSGAAIAILAVASSAAVIVATIGVLGLLYGAVTPSLASMLGLEAPVRIQGRVFGISSSAISLGFAFGPLLVSGIGGLVSITAAIWVAAGVTLVLAGVLAVGGREPQT